MNPILLDLGFIKIYWYSFFIFIALLVGIELCLHEAKKHNISKDYLINMFFWMYRIDWSTIIFRIIPFGLL